LYYSLKLTEMIYFKIPVIATRLETYCRYYPENCLIYFDSENVEELADKIIFVYKNRSDLSSFTENAYNEYQKINWEIMKERYINIIKSL
jgi:glycosyltransferase involved in cell wall biosynthesis